MQALLFILRYCYPCSAQKFFVSDEKPTRPKNDDEIKPIQENSKCEEELKKHSMCVLLFENIGMIVACKCTPHGGTARLIHFAGLVAPL